MAKKSPFSKLFSMLQKRLSGNEQESAPQETSPAPTRLKLLFFIVDWNQAPVLSDIFTEEKVRFHFLSKGKGTASSDILDLLGIGASEKAVMICLEQAVYIPVLMKEVRKKLGFHSPGHGIAFSVSLSAVNDPVIMVFKQSIHKNGKIAGNIRPKDEGSNMAEKSSRDLIARDAITNDLIIVVVNHGYSDELMNTARAAGASGGTVINARGQAHEGAVKFFGISVQDEKEIIFILTSRENKVPIMQAVCENHGLNTKAHGIVFSLPVDDVMGLSFE